MRRTRRLALTAAALLLVTGAAVGIDELLYSGAHANAVADALADAVMDPGSIFAERSPGARGGGLLLQTKPDRVALAPGLLPVGPEERVLASTRERPPGPELPLVAPAFALNQTGPYVDLGAPPAFPPSESYPTPPAGFTPAPPGLNGPLSPPTSQTSPPGGGPPGGGPPGGGPPGTPTTPVPEPDAWMLMILAVFATGAALRWRRAGQRLPQDRSTRLNA